MGGHDVDYGTGVAARRAVREESAGPEWVVSDLSVKVAIEEERVKASRGERAPREEIKVEVSQMGESSESGGL